jgi:hypothetical protein
VPSRVAFVPLACGTTKRVSVARFERVQSGAWQLVSASRPAAPGARAPDTIGAVEGDFELSPSYAGCAQCGADSYVKCGQCGQLSCWNTRVASYTCGFCGNAGPVSGKLSSVRRVD